jgi:hypothetical protein
VKKEAYKILDERFPTKKALIHRIREIRDKYQDGEVLETYDLAFMLEILKTHPEYGQKAGAGIKSMSVETEPIWNRTRCFVVLRNDQTRTDFSFMECLKHTSHAHKFKIALRTAIAHEITLFRVKTFEVGPVYCPCTGERLQYLGSHVDHKSPKTFNKLVSDFVDEYGIDVSGVVINGAGIDNNYRDTLADEELEASWIEFHRAHADLQVVSEKANLSILRQGRTSLLGEVAR